MSQDKSEQSNNWTEKWWFRYVIGIIIIVIGIADIIFWKSSVRLGIWTIFTTFLTDKTGWQFIILIALLIFRQQIGIVLVSLGNTLGRIRQLKVGENFTFSSEELVSALVDREVLKTIIRVAMAYDGIGEKEQLHLINRASPMKDHLQNLDELSKLQVIEEAINMALMDDEIQNPEYSVIQDVAENYGLDPKQVEDLIMKACFTRKGTIPPDLLKKKFEKEYGKLLTK